MHIRRGIALVILAAGLLTGCRDYVRTPLDLFHHAEELKRTGDRRGALLLYLRAAELGSYRAQFALASYYKWGTFARDGELRPTARRDSATAQTWLHRSIASARKAATEGDPEAPKLLGDLYFAGNGVPQDVDEARRFWSLSAARGNVEAYNAIGLSYYREGDYGSARDNFQVAFEQGSSEAALLLSRLYREGKGVDRDVVRSVELLRTAADAEASEAEQELNALLYGIGRAAQDGHPEATEYLHALQVANAL